MTQTWITPWKKQCFVMTGVSINIAQLGMVIGFAAVMVPQLRLPTSIIQVDTESESWIAATPGFALLIGNFTAPPFMGKYGRKRANLLSITICLIGWFGVVISESFYWLIAARFLQGLGMGMASCISPILIGEYSSPKNRGPFSILMSVVMAFGTLAIHAAGSFFTWQTTAIVGTCITFINLVIVVYSPESPTWLAYQGRLDDCRKSFRWLRGYMEEDELSKMLNTSKEATMDINKNLKGDIVYLGKTLLKKEFYKPILIMIHIYTMGQWAGINILTPYAVDIVVILVGESSFKSYVIIAMDIERVLSCIVAVYIIRNLKRRTMLFSILGVNTLVIFLTAAYSYSKTNGYFEHPAIGITLIMIHMFTVATGSLPLPYTIASEIFPLRYRSLSSGVSAFFSSINIFISVKTLPFLFSKLGVHGAYTMYGCILIYCLTITWFYLPETKDRTLQDIENDFKGVKDEKLMQPLTTLIEKEEI